MKAFADISDQPEDERIRIIGEFVERAKPGTIVGVVVDHDKDGVKARRYCTKLHARYKVRILDTSRGPVAKSTLIRVAQRGDA